MAVEIIRRGKAAWHCPECHGKNVRITATWVDTFWQCRDCGCRWTEKHRR